jgi:hypothetical protein
VETVSELPGDMTPKIKIAESDAEILKCFSFMVDLRPHLNEAEFPQRIKRQQSEAGYQLVFLEDAQRSS